MLKSKLHVGLGLLLTIVAALTFSSVQQPVAAQGPTATPNDPVWLSFDAARSALEEELQRNIRLVQRYEWTEAEFTDGISSCQTLEDGEEEFNLFFGWRFIITLLDGAQYEVRTSFNSEIVVVCDEVTTTAASVPEPAVAATNPDLAAPVTGPLGSGNLEVGGQVTGLFDNTVTALNQAGMRWVKFQAVHTVPFDTVVGWINEAQAKGFRILISAIGEPSTIMDPQRQEDYANFVGQLAGAGAHGIEVWNEPNIEREWPAGQVNGGNYTQVLARAYNAIKSANPNTIVVSGGPAPTGFFGTAGCTDQGCNDDVFYQQMAAAGAAQYMDCVGVHYNEGIVSPLQNSGDPRDNYGTRYYQTNMARALGPFPDKQACITEIGYLSGDGFSQGLPTAFAWASETSVQEHAQWLGEAVSVARQQGNVRLFIVFNVDFQTFTDDPQAGYAIIRPDGSCPACATIRAALG
ncbi:MAG: hypothetical protein ACLFTK_02965 [Anaerolineales bacterium]